jgi:hypothetical protein
VRPAQPEWAQLQPPVAWVDAWLAQCSLQNLRPSRSSDASSHEHAG